MLKSNIEGFVIEKNRGKNIELLNLKVNYKPIVKVKDGKEKTERYIGVAKFETKENIEILDSFDLKGIDKNNKEIICITGCKGLVEIEDKRYITNFDVKNVEISSIR